MKKIIESGRFYIKPAANHILTIGKGIIKDAYTAILELVKNSYDADAENVWIELNFKEGNVETIINDDGHGMDYATVTQTWMVPSTAVKLRQKVSRDKKRPLQGRKGIGRYAASILGNMLLLKTTDKKTLTCTELLINWEDFTNDDKFLEDVDILIESYLETDAEQGTKLEITGDKKWSDAELDELITSLRSLLSPFDAIDNDFNIHLKISQPLSEKYFSFSEQIKPVPILEYYHYRVFGNVDLLEIKDGKEVLKCELTLENKHFSNILPIKVDKNIVLEEGEKFCGKIHIDVRAFDLDEGLPSNNELNKTESKKLLKELPGVGVLRSGFRVRPYGDRKVDWLGLNVRRYNDPTYRLSSNQVAGFVTVLQEDESHLEEKATREGFKEDEHYNGLIKIILDSLTNLEELRYNFRKQHQKGGRQKKNLNQQLSDAINYSGLNNKLHELLDKFEIPNEAREKVKQIIEEETREKEEQIEEIKKTIAQYEGQVTLGRIMTIVLHEGRKPINALKQHPKVMAEWLKEFENELKKIPDLNKSKLIPLTEKILDRLNDNKTQAEIFVHIFKKLEPLAGRRGARKPFELSKSIIGAFKLFEETIDTEGIDYVIIDESNATFIGWEQDFYIVFANLIENSLYWMSNAKQKTISVVITEADNKITIDYSDSGLGIDEANIATQNIFDPGFTTKPLGTGLGLSIAGEALERNNGKIRAVSTSSGANFVIELSK
jgi:signal transduction histidine kinase